MIDGKNGKKFQKKKQKKSQFSKLEKIVYSKKLFSCRTNNTRISIANFLKKKTCRFFPRMTRNLETNKSRNTL